MYNYVHQMIGCKINWFSEPLEDTRECGSVKEIVQMYDLLAQINTWDYKDLHTASGKGELIFTIIQNKGDRVWTI